MSIKANVRKSQHFLVKSDEINFGTCFLNDDIAVDATLVVNNTTNRTRQFAIKLDPPVERIFRNHVDFESAILESETFEENRTPELGDFVLIKTNIIPGMCIS